MPQTYELLDPHEVEREHTIGGIPSRWAAGVGHERALHDLDLTSAEVLPMRRGGYVIYVDDTDACRMVTMAGGAR